MHMSRETREGIRSFVLDGSSWQQFRIAVRDNEYNRTDQNGFMRDQKKGVCGFQNHGR